MALKLKFHSRDSRGGSGSSPTRGGKVLGTFFFGIFLAFGLFFTALVAGEFQESAATYAWEDKRCVVTSSRVKRSGGDSPYQAAVDFRLAEGGTVGVNRHLRLDDPSDSSWDKAHRRIADFPVDAVVPCYVSSSGDAVLLRGPLWIGFGLLLTMIFAAIGGVGLYATWQPKRRDSLGMPLAEAMASSAHERRSGRGMQGFGVVFVMVGLGVGWFLAVKPLSLMAAAQAWDRETCTVENSSVVSHQSDDGTTYSVDILYRWDRGRGVERSSRYSFWGGSSSGSAGKYDIVKRYPKGGEVDCWLDPDERYAGVLNRGITGHAALGLIPLLFLCVGAGLFVYARSRSRQEENLRKGARMGALPFSQNDPVLNALPLFDPARTVGPLMSSTSRWGRVAGVTFAALFWNGIVSIFAYQAWQSWQRGNVEYGLMLFLVPFVLVGIGLVGGIGWTLLSLFNARPIVEMNRSFFQLGDNIELRWHFEGNVSSIEELTIVLRGREQATYQVGTNSHTQTEDFHVEELLNVSGERCAIGGHLSALIPVDSMHSFESAHNEIVWCLEIRGEIRRWPDVSEDYPLVILPGAKGDNRSWGEGT